MNSPTPAAIRERRQRYGLTQTAAARLIHAKLRSWQDWDGGKRTMHPAFWELFQLNTAALDVA